MNATKPFVRDRAEKYSGEVIVGAHKSVFTCEDTNVLYCKTLKEALEKYLMLKKSEKEGQNEKVNIKLVLVKNKAPSTSHEATQFRAAGIPVIKVDEDIKTERGSFLIDTQRGTVYQDKVSLSAVNKDFSIEHVVENGLIAYPLSSISTDWYDNAPERTLVRLKEKSKNIGNYSNTPKYLLAKKAASLLAHDYSKESKIEKTTTAMVPNSEFDLKDERSVYIMALKDFAQTEELKKRWICFVKGIDSLPYNDPTKDTILTLIRILDEFGILTIWINTIFSKKFNIEERKNSEIEFSKKSITTYKGYLRDIEQGISKNYVERGFTDCPEIKDFFEKTTSKLNQEILKLTKETPCMFFIKDMEINKPEISWLLDRMYSIRSFDKNAFEDPKDFKKSFETFKKLLGSFTHENIQSFYSDIEKLILSKVLLELVKTFDLSIKSLTGSTKYEYEDKCEKFRALLKLNCTLLENILCSKNKSVNKRSF